MRTIRKVLSQEWCLERKIRHDHDAGTKAVFEEIKNKVAEHIMTKIR